MGFFELDLIGVFGLFWDIYAPTNVCVKDIGSKPSMVLQNYQNFTEMTSNMIHIVAFGVGLECPCIVYLCLCREGVQKALT